MTRNAGKFLLILSLLVASGRGVASAQIADTTIESNIPYAFTVGTTTLPAGKYAIKVLDDTDPSTFEIRSADGHTTVIFETQSAQANQTPRRTELVFNKLGDRYFLWQIWLEGSNLGNELEKTKAEKKLEAGGIASEHPSVVAKHSKGAKGKASMESKNTKPNQ
jgi:hypothetical protein